MELDSKPWWESKAQWGLLAAAAGFLLQGFGIVFDSAAATEVIWAFVQAIGLVMAFWGNMTRKTTLDTKQVLPGLRFK